MWVLLLVTIVALVVYAAITSNHKEEVIYPSYGELVEHIDSLNNELSLLLLERDSLYKTIQQSEKKVDTIEHWYEKELIDITNQSITDDVVFFTEYLSETGK